MKYFTYKEDVINTVFNDENTSKIYFEDFDITRPAIFSANKIKQIHDSLKQYKEEFRKLVGKEDLKKLLSNFLDGKNFELLLLLDKFYDINWDEIYKRVEKEYLKEFPNKFEIKTNMYQFEGKYLEKSYNRAKAVVYAKHGVKLSKFKKYTEEELDELINNRSIVIVGHNPYGFDLYTAPYGSAPIHTKSLKYNFWLYNGVKIDEKNLSVALKKFPEIIPEILADLRLNELANDYTEKFVPAYKNCLKYLEKCIEVSVANEEKEKIELLKKRDKCTQRVREYNELTKKIQDTSKGR